MEKELRVLRKRAGYTREFIAKKLGVSGKYLNRIESGEGAMPESRAIILSKLYEVQKSQIIKIWRDNNEKYLKERARVKEKNLGTKKEN